MNVYTWHWMLDKDYGTITVIAMANSLDEAKLAVHAELANWTPDVRYEVKTLLQGEQPEVLTSEQPEVLTSERPVSINIDRQ